MTKFITKNHKKINIENKPVKSVSSQLEVKNNQPLTIAQAQKVLKDRGIKNSDFIPIPKSRAVSIHPTNPELDVIQLKEDSPHIYDESRLNKDPELRKKQMEKVKNR